MKDEIPDSSNFHSSLHTSFSRKQVALLYQLSGWKIRKCSFADYEISCLWAELVIEADAPILMHGAVAHILDKAELILTPLRKACIPYTAECYDDTRLIRKLVWSPV